MLTRKHTRSYGGMLAIIVFLALIVADATFSTVSLAWDDKLLLIALISGLTGVDIVLYQGSPLRGALEDLGVSVLNLGQRRIEDRIDESLTDTDDTHPESNE